MKMKAVTTEIKSQYLSRRSRVLLSELQGACQQVLKVLAQLETPDLTGKQVDEILGELSALIVHLHGHTRGLDEVIDRDKVVETR